MFVVRKVLPYGRMKVPLKICLCRQVFVCEETSRSHLVWSTDGRILTDIWVIKIDLSELFLWCKLGLCLLQHLLRY